MIGKFLFFQLNDALVFTTRDPAKARQILVDKLYEIKKLDHVIELAVKTNDKYVKEIACKMFGELSIEEPNLVHFVETNITAWCDELLEGYPSSYSGMIGKASALMKNSFYAEARDLLESCKFIHCTN